MNTEDPYGKLLAVGVGASFAIQSYQNIGMTMGLTPITGLPLPFVSYGGSSLVSSYAALARVARVATQRVRVLSSQELEPAASPTPVPAVEPHRAKRLVAIWRD